MGCLARLAKGREKCGAERNNRRGLRGRFQSCSEGGPRGYIGRLVGVPALFEAPKELLNPSNKSRPPSPKSGPPSFNTTLTRRPISKKKVRNRFFPNLHLTHQTVYGGCPWRSHSAHRVYLKQQPSVVSGCR